MKEPEWVVIRKEGITVAQGYKCPICGLIQLSKICPQCDGERNTTNEKQK